LGRRGVRQHGVHVVSTRFLCTARHHYGKEANMPDTDLATQSGLEFMRRVQTGLASGAPNMLDLLGIRFHQVEHGQVVLSLDTRPDFANLLGIVHGGIAATLLDAAMGCAVHTTLPAGTGYTTAELNVNFIRPANTDGQTLTATGILLHAGRRIASAQAQVTDERG
jgi:uncharacterized protein (TIGR00369 family)